MQGKISDSEFNNALNKAVVEYAKSRKVTKPIQNTPKQVPINTVPIIEESPKTPVKDCGWFGEKCAFDGIAKGFEEAGKNLDNFVKEEQKKQEKTVKDIQKTLSDSGESVITVFSNMTPISLHQFSI